MIAKLLHKYRLRAFHSGLNLIHDVLREQGLHGKYWVCGGAILGLAREGRLLQHDPDIDFHFWAEDHERFVEAFERLSKMGFKKKYRWLNNQGHPTEYVLSFRGVHFEFFEAHKHSEQIRWYCYCRRHWKRPSRQFLNAVPNYGLEPFRLFDQEWFRPDNCEGYLTALYGDWRTPCPDYTFYIDSLAIIQRERWQGSRKW